MRRITSLFAALPFLASCSSLGITGPSQNSGQIEYRIAEPIAVTEAQITRASGDAPLAPARLIRRYSGAREPFNSTPADVASRDIFSITLEQAVLGGFIGEQRFAQPAEVAILANAFEFDANGTTDGGARFYEFPEFMGPRSGQDGSPTDAAEGFKLIYFSSDVYLYQPLNFSALPIIPPSAYNGRPIGIQIVILELDRMSGPLKSLLRELASLGQASNAANAAPGLGSVALELGTSLLSGNINNDDVIFEYRMVLYPQHLARSQTATASENALATFQPGRYVLRRVEDRQSQVPWDDLLLDHNTARLYASSTSTRHPPGEEVREDTYVVFNVTRHPPGTPEAAYHFRNLAQFDEILAAASQTDGSESLDVLTENLGQRVATVRSEAWLAQLRGEWIALRNALVDLGTNRYPGLDPRVTIVEAERSDCPIGPLADLQSNWTQARLLARQSAVSFVTSFKAALRAGVTTETGSASQFSAEDQRLLVDQLALFAVPMDSSLEANFASTQNFLTAYITGKDGSELAQALTGAVQNVPREYSCSGARSRGWVTD